MANLAIRGHETRGREVIKVLEMLGGKERTPGLFTGDAEISWYYINEDGYINFKEDILFTDNTVVFTLEEFLEKYPYKVGDFVRIPEYESEVRIDEMKWDGFEIQYLVFTDETEWYSAEELNKYNEPYKEETMEEKSTNHVYSVDDVDVISFDIAQKDIYQLDLKDNFLVILREGKYYVERIKPKYPKTYEECYNVLGYEPDEDEISCYNGYLIESFVKLLICRDAYWKIAGEKMGLDNPWEPDWNDCKDKFCITFFKNKPIYDESQYINRVLAFPTQEIRDAFFENFKELIESCKELL